MPVSVSRVFDLAGDRSSPVVVSVPHAGTVVPDEVRAQLAVPLATADEHRDVFTGDLAAAAEPHAAVVRARIARAVIDLNRSGTVAAPDLSQAPEQDRDRLVRLYDRRGYLLWRAPVGQPPLARAEIERRIRLYHDPYHAVLQECLRQAGRPRVLLDLHSTGGSGLDLVIGDHRGHCTGAQACQERLVPFLAARGYRVGYAGPAEVDRQGRGRSEAGIRYSGGYITGRYGNPTRGEYAFQLEVSRERCAAGWAALWADLADLVAWLRSALRPGGWLAGQGLG